ncbi:MULTISPECIES: tail fiber domain-containing protein [Clostridia]|uniref:tail fiber domain-containing protein n=1 Tax=Clostridia TaxID=186801 RepID=UPI000E503ACF|nr:MULTISPECIES: tail fiber domain-containing protein [Clostridia]RHR04677.1 tail fiber domain-containing protein [Ruminococcus sp. AF20-12LB]
MAQLNNLIVTGSSRFLNKVYFNNGGTFNGNLNVNNGNINVTNGNLQLYGKVALQGYDNWLRINNSVNGTNSPFTYGIYCGNGTLRTDGEFQVGDGGNCFKANSSAITCNRSLIVNAGVDFGYGATIRNAGLELYFSTPFIDFHFNNSNKDFTSRIIESKESVLSINGVTCSSSNLAANNVSATNVNVSSRINADAATAIFNNVYIKDELRSTTWAIDNITNLGSTFYVSPCIIFTNPSVYINSKSGTTVTLTITDNNIISSTIGGQTWTSGSKIKLMGRINTSVLGVVNGTMARQLNTTTAKTAYITLNFATTNDCAGIEQGKTYSGSAIGDLKMMMYEVNLSVNGTTKNRPVGIRMSSYNEDKKSSIDIYNGTVDDGKPVARMGYLGGLPAVNGANPTGYGFYAAGNAYFNGTLVSSSGKIGGFRLSENSIQNGALGQSGSVLICTGTNSYASIGGSNSINGWCFTAGSTFGVTNTGTLYATNANITGVINANSGKIGSFTLDSTYLQSADKTVGLSPTASDWAFWAGGSNTSTAKFRVNHAGELYATGANISGNITATSGTIGKFYITKTYLAAGSGSTCIGMCGDQAFWAGNSSSNSAPFRVSYEGKFVSTNADITGTVNATTMRAKQKYSIYDSSYNVYQDVIQWFGSSLNIGLAGGDDNGTLTMAGAYFSFLDNNITCNGNLNIVGDGNLSVAETISANSIDATAIYTNNKNTSMGVNLYTSGTLTVKSSTTLKSTLHVDGESGFYGKVTARSSFAFLDYNAEEDANATAVFRRPIASAGSNKTKVAFLQSHAGNKISIRAQYGSTSWGTATFTGSSSDIRLKRDIKDSSVNALSKIMQMKIRKFNWKQTGVHQELGCVADELELIDPLLTVGGGYDDDGTMNVKCINTLLLTEYNSKAIQELGKENERLNEEIIELRQQLSKTRGIVESILKRSA